MRDLDSRAQVLMKSIDEKANEFMKQLVNSKENFPDDVKKEKLRAIQELFNKAKEFGDDKVQLAIQTYELVDKHIRRLDSDLARFEGEIQDKTLNAREKSEETVTKKGGRKKVKDAKSSAKKKRAHSSEDEGRATGASGAGASGSAAGNTSTNGKGKNTKKQKVNQEEKGRKGNKVGSLFHPFISHFYLFSILICKLVVQNVVADVFFRKIVWQANLSAIL